MVWIFSFAKRMGLNHDKIHMQESFFNKMQTFAGERIIDWKREDFQKFFSEAGFRGVSDHIMRALNVEPQYITPERERV